MWPLATWSDQSLCNGPGHIASSNDAYSPSPKPGLLYSLLNQWRGPCSLDWRRAWSCEVSRVCWSTTSWGSDSVTAAVAVSTADMACMDMDMERYVPWDVTSAFRLRAWSRPPKWNVWALISKQHAPPPNFAIVQDVPNMTGTVILSLLLFACVLAQISSVPR